jgi:hypothetical protein
MSETDANRILVKLEKIERENKFLKRCVVLILVVFGAIFVMAQAQSRPRTLEAERLVIRYPNGKEAITLGTFPAFPSEGLAAHAEFINPAGSVVVRITGNNEDGTVKVLSPKAEMQMYMSAHSTFPGNDLSKFGEVEATTLAIIGPPKGPLNIPLFELSGDSLAKLTRLVMYADHGSELRLTNGPDGPAMQLFDDPKTLRAVLGNTNLQTVRTGSKEMTALSSLVLFDKEGKVLWRAP